MYGSVVVTCTCRLYMYMFGWSTHRHRHRHMVAEGPQKQLAEAREARTSAKQRLASKEELVGRALRVHPMRLAEYCSNLRENYRVRRVPATASSSSSASASATTATGSGSKSTGGSTSTSGNVDSSAAVDDGGHELPGLQRSSGGSSHPATPGPGLPHRSSRDRLEPEQSRSRERSDPTPPRSVVDSDRWREVTRQKENSQISERAATAAEDVFQQCDATHKGTLLREEFATAMEMSSCSVLRSQSTPATPRSAAATCRSCSPRHPSHALLLPLSCLSPPLSSSPSPPLLTTNPPHFHSTTLPVMREKLVPYLIDHLDAARVDAEFLEASKGLDGCKLVTFGRWFERFDAYLLEFYPEVQSERRRAPSSAGRRNSRRASFNGMLGGMVAGGRAGRRSRADARRATRPGLGDSYRCSRRERSASLSSWTRSSCPRRSFRRLGHSKRSWEAGF